MKTMHIVLPLVAWLAVTGATPATADSSSLKGSHAATTSAGSFYIWADGSYQSVSLPQFGLGLQRDTATTLSAGSFETHNPRPSGYGVVGALGYVLPPGTLLSAFGSNARIEVGASYIDASVTQNGAGAPNGTPGMLWQTLNGLMAADTNCGAGACSTTSTLVTQYRSWNVHAKFAGSHRLDKLELTPSVLVSGGETRSEQAFSQTWYAAGANTGLGYSANSAMRWTDWGARAGLDAKFSLTNWLILGIGGNAGFAVRSVSRAANAVCGCAGVTEAPTMIAASDTVIPFVGNVEASFALKPNSSITLRGFGGLNYDSKVPGISAPSHSGPVAVSTFGTPAGIKYEALTSWYAGGGLAVALSP